MIFKSLRTLSGTVKINIPENLSEVTLGQMIEAENFTGENSIFHPLVPDLTVEIADNIIDINQRYDIQDRLLSLVHQIKYCYNETKLPETLMGIKVAKNLSIEPAGAFMASRDLIAEERMRHIKEYGDDWQEKFAPSLDCCAGVLANYFYCPVTKQLWNENKAIEFKQEILKLSIAEALPIARFFFVNYPRLSRLKMSIWQAFRVILKRKLESHRLKNLPIGTR